MKHSRLPGSLRFPSSSASYGIRRMPGGLNALPDPTVIPWRAANWASNPLGNVYNDSDEVSTWIDLSLSGRDQIATTPDTLPRFVASASGMNNRSGLSYDGIDDGSAVSSPGTKAPPYSLVVIGKVNNPVGSDYERAIVSTAGAYILYNWPALGQVSAQANGFTIGTRNYDSNAHFLVFYVNGASSYFEYNGVKVTGSVSLATNIGDIRLGGVGGDYANYTYGFFGFYDGDVTAHPLWQDFSRSMSNYYGIVR